MPHERLARGGPVRLGEGRRSNLLERFAEILLADLRKRKWARDPAGADGVGEVETWRDSKAGGRMIVRNGYCLLDKCSRSRGAVWTKRAEYRIE